MLAEMFIENYLVDRFLFVGIMRPLKNLSMRNSTLESTSSEGNGGFGKAVLGLGLAAVVAAVAATLKPWHPQAGDENTKIIDRVSDRVSDTVRPRPIPARDCDPRNQTVQIAKILAEKLTKCCGNVTKKWDGQPEEVMSQVVIEAIAECSDIPTNPCAFDVKRLEDALKICRKGEAM